MDAKSFLTELVPKMPNFWAARAGWAKPEAPITVTYSVTNACQSRCKTCNIWEIYPKKWQTRDTELTLEELEQLFESIGHIYFFNISGGEPFLRRDLPEIIGLAIDKMTPRILHSPTNALAPKRIETMVVEICEKMVAKDYTHVPLTIKPSYDGIGEDHDFVRGIPGNFEKLLETVERLKAVAKEYDFLHVEVGTVISNYNKHKIDEIADFAHTLGIESYRNEIAEQREEFLNVGDPITPSPEEYRELIDLFSERIRRNMKEKRLYTRVTEAFRLVYYQYVVRIQAEKRQVLPCYAGITNIHLNPHGDVWPCCVLGYRKSMGNVRDYDLDMMKLLHSDEAEAVRRFIAADGCACPLANQSYSNILMNPAAMAKVAQNMLAA